MMNSLYSTRPVTDDDREVLLEIYKASREIELSMTNWAPELRRRFCEIQLDAQTAHYKELYPDASHQIILVDEIPAGRTYVHRGDDQIAILDLAILAEFRGRGIGTSVIKRLQAEAEASSRFLRVYLEDFNPAQKLFITLGFRPVEDEQINIRYEWRALTRNA